MLEPVLRVIDLVPPIDARRYKERFGESPEEFQPRILGSRYKARELVARLPVENVTLDFSGIEVMSPPFAHEILNLRPAIEVTGMNEDVAISWEIATERSRPG